jgi:GPI-anchor transamidase subunit T
VTRITNTHWAPLNIVQQETIPWFVPIYLHTLRLTVGDIVIQPIDIKYIPGKQRTRPYHLEVAFQIPARATLELSIDFDYVFLKWQEYPPDASHGHYIGAATISTLLPTARNYTSVPLDGCLFADSFNATRANGYFLQLRTEALLITLPTPDFSMPYNVICLACTVVALAFGPIHNLSTKKITIQNKDAPQSMLGKLKQRFFKKKDKKVVEVEATEGEKKDEHKELIKSVDK